ncbi:MAG: SEL1-like repeat protein [Gammaproteobacteria bacterium]|nr:SEL1-like repeat protein [Gammaproteobacteria bacterium]
MKEINISFLLLLGLIFSTIVCAEADSDYFLGQQAYDKQDYSSAAKYWQLLAEQGHVLAQFKLATLYDEGHGVQRDITKAKYWYAKAAQQGYMPAQFNLGLLDVVNASSEAKPKYKEQFFMETYPDCASAHELVYQWAEAWSSRDIKRYFSFYAPNFAAKGMTRDEWIQNRSKRIKQVVGELNVTVRDLRMIQNGSMISATFEQTYQSSNYQDQVEKTLVFDNVGGKCRIVEEKVSKGRLY